MAAIATSANDVGDSDGTRWWASSPIRPPVQELMMRIGANVPPDVPDASASHQITSLPTASVRSVAIASLPARASSITS